MWIGERPRYGYMLGKHARNSKNRNRMLHETRTRERLSFTKKAFYYLTCLRCL